MKRAKLFIYTMSLIFVAICFGASIWLSFVLRDSMSYIMATLFGVALVWFTLQLFTIYRENKANNEYINKQ